MPIYKIGNWSVRKLGRIFENCLKLRVAQHSSCIHVTVPSLCCQQLDCILPYHCCFFVFITFMLHIRWQRKHLISWLRQR